MEHEETALLTVQMSAGGVDVPHSIYGIALKWEEVGAILSPSGAESYKKAIPQVL